MVLFTFESILSSRTPGSSQSVPPGVRIRYTRVYRLRRPGCTERYEYSKYKQIHKLMKIYPV